LETDDTHYTEHIIDETLIEARGFFDFLSTLTLQAFEIQNNKIKTLLIDDELTIHFNFNKNVLLTGKIDLVLYDSNKLYLVELKTGNKYDSDRSQILLYGEIIRSKYPNIDIELQLWYQKKNA